MLSKTEKFILQAIRNCFLLEQPYKLLDNDLSSSDKKAIIGIVRKNGILLTVYHSLPETFQKELTNEYYSLVRQSILQEYEGNNIIGKLSGAGFRCIALKGWELRTYYPQPNMRQMADLDILIYPYDYERIKAIMIANGFSESGGESNWKHDNFKKQCLTVEAHKRLTDDSGIIHEWEKSIWSRIIVDSINNCKMSFEDFYIFHFIHLHKDFLNGSLGLRRIVDTWLLQKESFDQEYVLQEFKRMGLSLFYERMIKLSMACMGDSSIDEKSELLLKHAFRYGIYGTDKSYKAGRLSTMGKSLRRGKIKSWVAAIFLPVSRMKAQFPKLNRWPFLLPYYWIIRIVRYMRGDIKHKRAMLDYRSISEEDFAEFKAYLEAGGCQ